MYMSTEKALTISQKLENKGVLNDFKRSNTDKKHCIKVVDGLIKIDDNPEITWDTFTHYWLTGYKSDEYIFEFK